MRAKVFSSTATVFTVLAVACAAVGCSSAAASEDAVAWTNQVCSALAGFTQAATDQPKIDQTNPEATVRAMDGYLGSTSEELQHSLTALEAVGPSPVEGGDQYVTRLRDALTSIRAGFDSARGQLASVDTTSQEAFANAFPAAFAPLQELSSLPDPTKGLRANDALRTASEQATSCRELRSVGA